MHFVSWRCLPNIKGQDSDDLQVAGTVGTNHSSDPGHTEGAALRTLRQLSEEKNPQQHWGGFKKIFTPVGHYLGLCEHQSAEYK